ncbi:MAG TPA: hypothetical protein VN045_12295 [Microbacteriaceae bacterium]|nr:hypothetical protein [Microbacteriaceae bacterium]
MTLVTPLHLGLRRHHLSGSSIVLDVICVLGIVGLGSLVALVARGVEKL